MWPHAGGLNQRRDGVTLSRYQMTLYTFAHETGHMLFGWPDLYGFGDYCLMGNATTAANPAGINDFFRADQGWIPAVEVDASASASFAATPNGTGYLFVNPNDPKELFFWSNIQPEQRWSVLKGGGLLVLHYDGTIRGNNPPDPLQLAVVQADNKKDLDKTMWPSPGSDTNDFFRSNTRSEFSSTTMPRSSWNDNSASGLRIHSISASGAEMTFAVGSGSAGAPPASGGSNNDGASPGGNAGRGGASTAGGGSSSGGKASGGMVSSAGAAQGGASAQGGTSAQGGAPVAGATNGSGGATGGANSPASGGTSGVGSGGSSNGGGIAGSGGARPQAGSAQSGGAAPASGFDDSSTESGCTTTGPTRGTGAWFAVAGLATAFALARRRWTPGSRNGANGPSGRIG